ncbi:MAG: putative toxin-antitoxin system toxin component, PIN family [Bacilli bacterium]|nr:putative toxin-antitoxin system toxin component, PIN family [Bacilli bacterium]
MVVDTNIVISGVFFGGFPQKVVEAVSRGVFASYVSKSIVEEYREITEAFKEKGIGYFDAQLLSSFLNAVNLVEPKDSIAVCRDPDDDKFLECAVAAKALYIVSGDKDLLLLERYKDIEIITAKNFCERYLRA